MVKLLLVLLTPGFLALALALLVGGPGYAIYTLTRFFKFFSPR